MDDTLTLAAAPDPLPGLHPVHLEFVTVWLRPLTRRDLRELARLWDRPDMDGPRYDAEFVARSVVTPAGGRVFAAGADLAAVPAPTFDRLLTAARRVNGLEPLNRYGE